MASINNLRIGVVGVPGKWSTECLADALAAQTGFRQVIDIDHVTLDLANRALWYEGSNLCELDALAIKKISSQYSAQTLERLDLLRVTEAAGVRCFSDVGRVHRLVDRLSCTIALRNADIPMPETTVTETLDAAVKAVDLYGEAILKPLFSTKARGMVPVSAKTSRRELRKQLEEFQRHNPIMYIQKQYDLSGHDYGIVFVGNEYLCAYKRVGSKGSWNTTIHSGGKYASHIPDTATLALARRAHAIFKLDYTTVDIAMTEIGPVVFEVSAFGGFRGVKEGAGLDAAALYSDYIIRQLSAEP